MNLSKVFSSHPQDTCAMSQICLKSVKSFNPLDPLLFEGHTPNDFPLDLGFPPEAGPMGTCCATGRDSRAVVPEVFWLEMDGKLGVVPNVPKIN